MSALAGPTMINKGMSWTCIGGGDTVRKMDMIPSAYEPGLRPKTHTLSCVTRCWHILNTSACSNWRPVGHFYFTSPHHAPTRRKRLMNSGSWHAAGEEGGQSSSSVCQFIGHTSGVTPLQGRHLRDDTRQFNDNSIESCDDQ